MNYFNRRTFKVKKRKIRIRRISERQKIINECLKLLREILILKRGKGCEICGSTIKPLGNFHIMIQGNYPRLKFYEQNVLLSCWFPCHYTWHHDPHKAEKVHKRIQVLRGKDYRDRLLKLNAIAEKHTMVYLNLKRESLKQEVQSPTS